MAEVEKFEDLIVWKKARSIAKSIYSISTECRAARDFSLQDQMKRSAISIMANISEGFERGSNKEFIQYLFIAKGSAGETRSHLYMALDLGYIENKAFDKLNSELILISKQLSSLIQYLKSSQLIGAKRKE